MNLGWTLALFGVVVIFVILAPLIGANLERRRYHRALRRWNNRAGLSGSGVFCSECRAWVAVPPGCVHFPFDSNLPGE